MKATLDSKEARAHIAVSRENTEDGLHQMSHTLARSVKHGNSQSNTSNVSPRSQYHGAGNPFNQTNASLGHISSQTNTANVKGKIAAIEVK